MAFDNLIITDTGTCRCITLNRPKALNALNKKTLLELQRAFEDIASVPSIRAVVITGAGEKSFAAGADILEMRSLSSLEAERLSRLGQQVLDLIVAANVPVIAAVNGYALGGGLELALACDFIYAAKSASFGLVETKLGLIPGFGGNVRLMRRVGDAMAREMIFSAAQIDAQEASRIGLVNRVVEDAQLMESVLRLAEKIAQRGPYAVSTAKSVLSHAGDLPLLSANALEARSFGLVFSSEDRKEGISAFIEKRTPNFEGV